MTQSCASAPETLPGAQLSVVDLSVSYDRAIRALHDVSLAVPPASIVAMIGGNGAGKTALVRAVAGLLAFHRGRIIKGQVTLDGRSLRGLEPAAIVRAGVASVLQGKRVLTRLTVEENLRVGAFARRRGGVQEVRERTLELFPLLRERLQSPAGELSGGEQQMLALASALMSEPKLLLLDEPSLGLAPVIVAEVKGLIGEIARGGVGVLLIEQNARMALSVADYGYVMQNGRVVLEGRPELLLAGREIQDLYLGRLPRAGGAGDRGLPT